ncbi:unnamed protein product [Brassica oleracea]
MEALNEHGIDNPTAKQTSCLLWCTQRSVLSYTASTSPSYWGV